MALMIGSLYDALKSAGVDDASAREAAEEVAAHRARTSKVDDLILLRWMIGANVVLTFVLLLKVLSAG